MDHREGLRQVQKTETKKPTGSIWQRKKLNSILQERKNSHPTTSPPLSLHSSSVGRCEKGALKWKQKTPATRRILLPMQCYFHEASGQPVLASLLHVPWLLPTEADHQGLSGWRQVSLCAHMPMCTHTAGHEHTPKASPQPCSLARARLWSAIIESISLPFQPQNAVSFLLSRVRWALTQQGTQLLLLIQLQIIQVHCPKYFHQPKEVLQPWCTQPLGIHIFLFIFQELWIWHIFFFHLFFLIKTKVCVLAHVPSNLIYSRSLFNQSSTFKHKGPMIWGANVCASTGTNAQLIRAYTSAHRVNNLVQGYDV